MNPLTREQHQNALQPHRRGRRKDSDEWRQGGNQGQDKGRAGSTLFLRPKKSIDFCSKKERLRKKRISSKQQCRKEIFK